MGILIGLLNQELGLSITRDELLDPPRLIDGDVLAVINAAINLAEGSSNPLNQPFQLLDAALETDFGNVTVFAEVKSILLSEKVRGNLI